MTQKLFEEIEREVGAHPRIIQSSATAGCCSRKFGPFEVLTEQDNQRQQRHTMLLSEILTTQEAAKACNGSGGAVINLSTISSTNPSPNSLLYSASKSAIDTITRELALELAPREFGSTPSPPA